MRVLSSMFICVCLLLGAATEAWAERHIILYKSHALPGDLEANVQAAGGRVIARIDRAGIAIAQSDDAGFTDRIGADHRVRSVGPEPAHALPGRVAGDLVLDTSSVTDSPGQATAAFFQQGLLWGIERVHAPEAWAAGVSGSHATTVAVLDTGVAWNHPDLAPNVMFVACVNSAGAWIGPWIPGAPCNPYPSLDTHGTHVAGTVAASFDFGVVGVGPNLALASYNIFEFIPGCGVCSFTSSRWTAQLDAAARGFQVINMSLGAISLRGTGQGSDATATFVAADNRIANLVVDAGSTIVAAAGNQALDLNGTLVSTPAGLPGVVSVSGTGIQPNPRYEPGVSFDILAYYSNHGASVDITGPGGDCGQVGICDPATRPANWFEHLVLSTAVQPDPVCAQTLTCPLGWTFIGGTSMATPHVSGVVGLIRDQAPGLNARQAANRVQRTAERIGDRQSFGSGMVDARGAVD